MISILFLISSSYFDHIDVFLVFNFHLDENLRHVAPCQIFMTWHPCACQSWHKTLDKKFDTLAVNQYMLDWNNAASCFLLGSIIRSQSYWLGFDSMTWRWKSHFSHCDDQDGQKMISILFLVSSSYLDHIDVFLEFNWLLLFTILVYWKKSIQTPLFVYFFLKPLLLHNQKW